MLRRSRGVLLPPAPVSRPRRRCLFDFAQFRVDRRARARRTAAVQSQDEARYAVDLEGAPRSRELSYRLPSK